MSIKSYLKYAYVRTFLSSLFFAILVLLAGITSPESIPFETIVFYTLIVFCFGLVITFMVFLFEQHLRKRYQ